jgi:hypothetical protein
MSSTSDDNEPSVYLSKFLDYLEKINGTYIAKWPKKCFFVNKAKSELAQRLTRSFVSHIALLRPVGQTGRTMLTQDMALFEMSLPPLLEGGSDLGRSGAELHAFKQVLFLEDDTEPLTKHITKVLTFDTSLSCRQISTPNKNTKTNDSVLRPSTLLHHALARTDTPATLSSPTEELRIKHQHLVEWLVAGTPLPASSKYLAYAPPRSPLVAQLSVDSGAHREAHAWAAFSHCLDTYSQRRSSAKEKEDEQGGRVNGDIEGDKGDEVYKVLLEQGAGLVERYLKAFVGEGNKK